MGAVQIKDNAGDQRTCAVLASAHAQHAIGIDRNIFCVVAADGIGKIEQNAVRLNCGFNCGLNRRTESDFHADAAAVPNR